jgi:O-antigen/teichoic acid export membrane protein
MRPRESRCSGVGFVQMTTGNAQTAERSHGLLARNTALSFAQQVAPLFVAIITIPYVIHKLGVDRFGILSLARVLLGYTNIFDLGMGRATTRFVAQALGKGEHDQVPRIAFTSMLVQVTSGIVGGSFLAMFTPVLTGRLLHIRADLTGEARLTFWFLSASIPVIFITRNLRSLLEANQRFDLIAAVQAPASSISYLLPAVGAGVGYRLPAIILLMTAARVATAVVYLSLCLRVVPDLRRGIVVDRALLRPLLYYGGWVTVCDIVYPLLTYLDRFAIGAVFSTAAVAYYSAPYEAISKVLIIPSAIVLALFPALGTLSAVSREQVTRLYARAVKYTLLVMTPILVVSALFSSNILTVWLGKEYAQRSTSVLQLLSFGMLLWGVAQLPITLLDAMGRPDLRAKILLGMLAPYLLTLLYLTKTFGLNGTAASLLLRAAVELCLFMWLSYRLLRTSSPVFRESRMPRAALICGGSMAAGAAALAIPGNSFVTKALAAGLFLLLFASTTWRFIVDPAEKNYVLSTLTGRYLMPHQEP